MCDRTCAANNMDDRECDIALLTDIMRRFELHNRELQEKERRLRQQLQETRELVAARMCETETETDTEMNTDTDDEVVVPCPHQCWAPPPWTPAPTCQCGDDDTDSSDALSTASEECCPYAAPIVPSDISLDVTPSASEASSLGSLHEDDIAYLQQMEALAADERERLIRLNRLERRERDILRTAEVTRDVVDELRGIFGEGARPCRCGVAGVATAPAQTPPPPPEPKPPSRDVSADVQRGCEAPANTPHQSETASLQSGSIDLWAQAIAQTDKTLVAKASTAAATPLLSKVASVVSTATNKGVPTPLAATYPPTKTEMRLAQKDDPFRVASKISRIPSLTDIPESRNQSLADDAGMPTPPKPPTLPTPTSGELATITDVLSGGRISAENASLVSQNLSETKRRLSFMLQHSKECPQCEKSIKNSLKDIDQQLTVLANEFRQQHYLQPFPGTVPHKFAETSVGKSPSKASAPPGPAAGPPLDAGESGTATTQPPQPEGEAAAEQAQTEPQLDTAVGEETPPEVVADESPPEVVGDESPPEVVDEESPPEVVPEETPLEVVDEETPLEVVDEKTPPKMASEEEAPFDLEITVANETRLVDHRDASLMEEVTADIAEILEGGDVIEIPVTDSIDSALDVLRDLEFTENLEIIGEKEGAAEVAEAPSGAGEGDTQAIEEGEADVFYDSLDTVEEVAPPKEVVTREEELAVVTPEEEVAAAVPDETTPEVAEEVLPPTERTPSSASAARPSVVKSPSRASAPPEPATEPAAGPERMPTCPRLCPTPEGEAIAAPTQTEAVAKPSEASAKPSEAVAKPSEMAAKPSEASAKPPEAAPTPPEPAAPTQDDAEIALLQQVLLDQTAQIRMLVEVVKQFPIFNPPALCACQPCKGGSAALERVQQGLQELQEATELLPQ